MRINCMVRLLINIAFNTCCNLVPRVRDPLGRGTIEGLWHNPFVFPANPGDSVLLRMCKVFQDGGHANRNRHYILILERKCEECFVVLLSF